MPNDIIIYTCPTKYIYGTCYTIKSNKKNLKIMYNIFIIYKSITEGHNNQHSLKHQCTTPLAYITCKQHLKSNSNIGGR